MALQFYPTHGILTLLFPILINFQTLSIMLKTGKEQSPARFPVLFIKPCDFLTAKTFLFCFGKITLWIYIACHNNTHHEISDFANIIVLSERNTG